MQQNRRIAAVGNRWVYLDGSVGFGYHYFQIAQELASQSELNAQQVNYIVNKLSRGDYSNLDMHNVAIGRMFNGRPYIEHSAVDRNKVYDSVIGAYTNPIRL